MKETRRCFCNFSFYHQQAIQKKLEDMAERGWQLQKTGTFFWTYKRIEPKKLRFSVTYFPKASEFDPSPTDGELIKIDYCRQDGWELAARWGVMQIFCNENLDAVPIETEPITQVENLWQSMKKNVLLTQAVLGFMLLFNLAIRFSQWKRDPIGELSSPLSFYTVLMFGVLLFACLIEITSLFRWKKKASVAARNNGVFLPVPGRPVVSWILAAISTLLLLWICSALTGQLGFVILWFLAVPLLTALGNLIKKFLKKRGVERNVNRILSVCSVWLMTVLFLGIITIFILRGGDSFSGKKTAIGTYELYGRTREIYNDSLPLEIEDLTDGSEGVTWSKEANHQETFLLSHTKYRQYTVPIEEKETISERELDYSITEVKWGFLYDTIKEAALDTHQDEIYGDTVFTDHYEPVDASVWNVEEAYQLHWSDSILHTYLLCRENQIVELTFYWEPTPEQIAAAVKILFQSTLGNFTEYDS